MTGDGFESAAHEVLSPSGLARRESMLGDLDAAMRRRNIARTGVKLSVVLAPLVVLACIVWLWPRGGAAVPGGVRTMEARRAPAPSEYRFIRFVDTDPTVIQRLSATPVPDTVRAISDDELQALLASMGRDSGFVRTGGRVILVTDLQQPRKQESPGSSDGHSSI